MTEPGRSTWSPTDMDETFRLSRMYRLMGGGFLLGFLAWAGIDLALTLRDPTIPHRVAFGVLAVGVPIGMAGLSAWLLAHAWRSVLVIRGGWVSYRGVFGVRSVDLGEVHEVRWRCFPAPGESVVLRAGPTRLAIDLSVYGLGERARIVGHLRELLPDEVQVGWNLYAYRFPPFGRDPSTTKPGPDEVVLGRDHWDRYFAPALAATCVLGLFLWRSTGDSMRLVACLMLVPTLWLPVRFLTPARGIVARRLRATSFRPEALSFLGFLGLWFVVAVAGLFAHEAYHTELAHPNAILVVGAVAWLAILLREAYRIDRRIAQSDREAADLAAKGRCETLSKDFD